MAPGNADLIRPIYEAWGRGKGSGVEIRQLGAHVRLEIFASREKALASVHAAREEAGGVRLGSRPEADQEVGDG